MDIRILRFCVSLNLLLASGVVRTWEMKDCLLYFGHYLLNGRVLLDHAHSRVNNQHRNEMIG